jgi:hypothetical protein
VSSGTLQPTHIGQPQANGYSCRNGYTGSKNFCFILAKATGGAAIAADSIDHLRRYIEMLFGVETEQAKHLTEGDSK